MDYSIYIVVGIYLLFLSSIGIVFKKLNSDQSDFFRSGCRGNWWMVGMSMYMSGISTQTFVANSGVVYMAGTSMMSVYVAGAICLLIQALGLAAWYRQARVTTFPEIVRERFGKSFQQFFAYYATLMAVLFGGIGLYQLALFARTAFGLPIFTVIIALGAIVLFYTVTGGNWAVLAGDFLQSLVLIPMIFLLAGLSLWAIGGVDGFFEALRDSPDVAKDFSFIDNTRADGLYGIEWVLGVTLMHVYGRLGMAGGHRFFSCKHGNEAKKAAWLCLIIHSVTTLIFFIPPMVGRLLYDQQIMSADIPNPQDLAYAFMSHKLLPYGFLSLMVVAMFSAQMSSLDTSLNANSAMVMLNMYRPAMMLFGKKPAENPKTLLLLGRFVTFLFGLLVIIVAVYFSRTVGSKGIFEIIFKIQGLVSIPIILPMFFGFYIRRTPWWSGWVCSIAALIPAFYGHLSGMSTPRTALISSVVGLTVFIVTLFFWKKSSQSSRDEIMAFSRKIKTPINYAQEVGENDDTDIFKAIGILAGLLGTMIWLFLLFPNPFLEKLCIVGVAMSVQLISAIMLLIYYYRKRKLKQIIV